MNDGDNIANLVFGIIFLIMALIQLVRGKAFAWSWQGEMYRKTQPFGFWLRIAVWAVAGVLMLSLALPNLR